MNHRASCSASVQARHTRSRGAANIRVMLISRTIASSITAPLRSCSASSVPSRGFPLALRCALVGLGSLDRAQVLVQPIQPLVPEAAIVGEPVRDLVERLGL